MLDGISMQSDPALLVGFDKSDDACVYKVNDELALVQTVDFFPPVVDDPYTFGQVAAANALSDVYAMGGEPKTCLNVMGVPRGFSKEIIREILRGGYDKVYEAGAIVAGGHTILDEEPKYGLSVTGYVHPDRFYRNCGAKPGDVLILTKPLGTGILTTAAKAGLLAEDDQKAMIRIMTELNKKARDVFVQHTVHACTDVTGFGLMGHLFEMVDGTDCEAVVDTQAVEILPAALEFARMGILAEGMYRNRDHCEAQVDPGTVQTAVCDALFDPQTSGGLLAAVAPEDAEPCLAMLQGQVLSAQRIGTVRAYQGGKRIFLK